MIINHVENHSQSDRVSAIHKATQVVRLAIEPGGGEQVDAVVAPTKAAGEIGQRHQLDCRNSQGGQFRQFLGSRSENPLLCKRPHVHFIEHLAFRANPWPGGVLPNDIAADR